METQGQEVMTIYVDELTHYHPSAVQLSARQHGTWWCHMWTDGPLSELHAFAARLGLKPSWFQPKEAMLHYDLLPSKREKALAKGAMLGNIKMAIRERRAHEINIDARFASGS